LEVWKWSAHGKALFTEDEEKGIRAATGGLNNRGAGRTIYGEQALTRLPKAPLVEAVFELRWQLQEGPPSQPALHADPGLLPLMDAFTRRMKTARYATVRDFVHPLAAGPYGVVRRFFLAPEKPFPIMQIGPGIFAANDGPLYSWKDFKSQIKAGVKSLLMSYPSLDFFALRPISLELRYVDVFDKSSLPKAALLHFLSSATTLKIELPSVVSG
jgi:uncharacterized protein (TIGR04255 family)